MVGGGLVAKACLILETPWTVLPTRLLCPWDFPDRNSGASCHFLLQGNLPDLGIEPESPVLIGGFFTAGHQGNTCLELI